MKRYDILIVNRSFWPYYPALGEALLKIAKKLALTSKVGVAFQTKKEFKKNNKKRNIVGGKVKLFPFYSFDNFSTNLIFRICNNFFFFIHVAFCLIITRPKKIYISTDPPILIPFLVFIYSFFSKAKYIYHIQDIHPEAAHLVLKFNKLTLWLLKQIDNLSISNAAKIITLTLEMKKTIKTRLTNVKNILIIQNPSIFFPKIKKNKKKNGFLYTGNFGRFQRVKLLCLAIEQYLNSGGNLHFYFAGSGKYSYLVKKLANYFSSVHFYGQITPKEAAKLSTKFTCSLLPIEDEITNYAFPSKISSYICSDSNIVAICSKKTNVSKFILKNRIGIVIEPKLKKIVSAFFQIEKKNLFNAFSIVKRNKLKEELNINFFVKKIVSLLNNL